MSSKNVPKSQRRKGGKGKKKQPGAPPSKAPLKAMLSKAAKQPIDDRDPRAVRSTFARYAQCAKQFLDPTGCDDLQICPDESSQPRCIRRIPRTFNVEYNEENVVDGFNIVVQPRLVAPIWFTDTPSFYPSPQFSNGVFIKSEGISAEKPSNAVNNSTWLGAFEIGQAGNSATAIARTTDLLGVTIGGHLKNLSVFDLETDPGGGEPFFLSLTNSSANDPIHNVEWYCLTPASPDWVYLNTTKTLGSSNQTQVSVKVGNILQVALSIQDSTNNKLHLQMHMASDSMGVRFPMTATNPLNGRTSLAKLGDSLKGGRLVGLSLLAQNTTAGISQQGKIYAVRAPRSMNPYISVGEIQNVVSTNHYYDGPAAKGAYVWWYPGSYEPLKYQEEEKALEYLNEDCYLMIAVRGWNTAGPAAVRPSFSIQVTAIVEFYDTSVLFEKINPPLPNATWVDYQRVLQSLPAATCNPAHETLLNTLRKKLKSGVEGALSAYNAHPQLFHSLLSALMA